MRGNLWGGVIMVGVTMSGLTATQLATAQMADHAPSSNGQGAEVIELIASVRAATLRFEDINVALAEGYMPDPSGECVTAAAHGMPAELGAMGIHYLRPDLLGLTVTTPRVDGTSTHTDFMNPAILLYEPQTDGSMVLVGVENLVFSKAWETAGHQAPPTLAGRTWDYMVDDPATPTEEAHYFEAHYDQHLWFRDNPNGNLEPFNPAVTCRHHKA